MNELSYTYSSWVSSDETVWYAAYANCAVCGASEVGESMRSFNAAADIARELLSSHDCTPTLWQRVKAWWRR